MKDFNLEFPLFFNNLGCKYPFPYTYMYAVMVNTPSFYHAA